MCKDWRIGKAWPRLINPDPVLWFLFCLFVDACRDSSVSLESLRFFFLFIVELLLLLLEVERDTLIGLELPGVVPNLKQKAGIGVLTRCAG